MDAADLLLSREEQAAEWLKWRGLPQDPQVNPYELSICRAQVAKVLAVLEADAQSRGMFWSGRFIDSIIAETGLTWPPKEG